MTDSNWDNQGHPLLSEKKMSFLAKIGIGCGVVAVAFFAVLFVGYLSWARPDSGTKGNPATPSEFAKDTWPRFLEFAHTLETDNEAIQLYKSNSALVRIYPTEKLFLESVHGWRPLLLNLPGATPSTHHFRASRGITGLNMAYKVEDGRWLVVNNKGHGFVEESMGHAGITKIELVPESKLP